MNKNMILLTLLGVVMVGCATNLSPSIHQNKPPIIDDTISDPNYDSFGKVYTINIETMFLNPLDNYKKFESGAMLKNKDSIIKTSKIEDNFYSLVKSEIESKGFNSKDINIGKINNVNSEIYSFMVSNVSKSQAKDLQKLNQKLYSYLDLNINSYFYLVSKNESVYIGELITNPFSPSYLEVEFNNVGNKNISSNILLSNYFYITNNEKLHQNINFNFYNHKYNLNLDNIYLDSNQKYTIKLKNNKFCNNCELQIQNKYVGSYDL